MQHNITLTTPAIWPQYIEGPCYLRGSIRGEDALFAAYVTDSSGETVHYLLNPNDQQAEVFWYVARSDHYQLHVIAATDNPVQVTLTLASRELKSNQAVSPQHPLLSPLLTDTATQLADNSYLAEHAFWRRVTEQGTPLIEPHSPGHNLVTFLYRGDTSTHNVQLLGAPYDNHVHLGRLTDSHIWFISYVLPSHTRLSYRLAVNVPQLAEDNWVEQYFAAYAVAALDAGNPRAPFGQAESRFGAASTLTLPHASSDTILQSGDAPTGSVLHLHYTSQQLSNTRPIHLYQPHASYPLSEHSPLLILFDGHDYLSKVPTPVILDNLIAQGHIPPLRAVFIDPPSAAQRAQELTPNAAYADFIATEFKPWLNEYLNICPAAHNTVLSGSSFGGLAAMYIAMQYPDQFGKVLCQSGSFWWAPTTDEQAADPTPHWFADKVTQMPQQPVEIYMNAGLFEIKPASHEILENNRILAAVLAQKGYCVTFEQVAGGHDYFSWQVSLASGLRHLFRQYSA